MSLHRGRDRDLDRQAYPNRGFISRSYQNRKKAEVDFPRKTRRSNLRGISPPKSERVGRAWIAITTLLTSRRGIVSLLAFKFLHELINDSYINLFERQRRRQQLAKRLERMA
jgi:hypothetical protein